MKTSILTVHLHREEATAIFTPKTGQLRADPDSRRQKTKSFWTCSEAHPSLQFLKTLTAHHAHIVLTLRGLSWEWT